jgi:hypothetical protein
LKSHSNDESLTDKYATHTWQLEIPSKQPQPHGYRFFRILQTGKNSSKHNFLVINGIEFYGSLFEWPEDNIQTRSTSPQPIRQDQ